MVNDMRQTANTNQAMLAPHGACSALSGMPTVDVSHDRIEEFVRRTVGLRVRMFAQSSVFQKTQRPAAATGVVQALGQAQVPALGQDFPAPPTTPQRGYANS
jgi:hypothetical protein